MKESIQQPVEPKILRFLSFLRYPFALLGGVLVTFLACTVFAGLSVLLRQRRLDNYVIWCWGFLVCKIHGVKVRVSGLENIPSEGCILLFNHSSLFDIPIMYQVLPKDFRYGAKAELFRIPIFGLALKVMGALPIHRAKRADVLKLYEQSVERVHRGESFALAPEGTRQKVAEIGPFKNGPFLFAIQAQAPIVPIVIKGALETLGKDDWIINRGRWHRWIELKVLPPVATNGAKQEDLPQVLQSVRGKMIEAYSVMH